MFCRQGLKWSGKLLCDRTACGQVAVFDIAEKKPGKRHRTHTKNSSLAILTFVTVCVSFPSPKHDSDRSSGKRSRVLLHSAAAIFSGCLPDTQKGAKLTLRCGVVYSAIEDLSNSDSVDFAEVERFSNWCRNNSL